MPQLPSGRHVCITVQPALDAINAGNLGVKLLFSQCVQTPEDIAPLVTIGYYKISPLVDSSAEALASGFTLSDVVEGRSDWCTEDRLFFIDWVSALERQQWVTEKFSELRTAVETSSTDLPKTLHGILEADD